MKTWMIALMLVSTLSLPAASWASAVVDVNSDYPGFVYLDGRPVGYTPVRLSYVPGGTHQVRVDSTEGRGTRQYAIRVPFGESLPQTIVAQFAQPQVVVVEAPRRVVVSPVIVAPIAPAIVVRSRFHRHRH